MFISHICIYNVHKKWQITFLQVGAKEAQFMAKYIFIFDLHENVMCGFKKYNDRKAAKINQTPCFKGCNTQKNILT